MSSKLDQAKMHDTEKAIYKEYYETIVPFIVTLEVLDGEFPVEILNEIRAIFSHISAYKLNNSESDLQLALGHVKRAVLDCYKYMCVSIEERIKEFRHEYRHANLSMADNGKFLPEINRLHRLAKDKMILAKRFESVKTSFASLEERNKELYTLYESAFLAYNKLSKYLDDSNEAILFASSNSKKTNRNNIIINIAIAVASLVIGYFINQITH